MISEELSKEVDYCKTVIQKEIDKTKSESEKFRKDGKLELPDEVVISIIYLKVFSEYIQQKKIDDINDAWRFMHEEVRGVSEKVYYVKSYLQRLQESLNRK